MKQENNRSACLLFLNFCLNCYVCNKNTLYIGFFFYIIFQFLNFYLFKIELSDTFFLWACYTNLSKTTIKKLKKKKDNWQTTEKVRHKNLKSLKDNYKEQLKLPHFTCVFFYHKSFLLFLFPFSFSFFFLIIDCFPNLKP